MKATILSGSSRSNNNTLRVSKAIERALVDRGLEVDLVDFRDYDLPFFNGDDVELDNMTGFQKHLIESWASSEIVFVVSPEYNWFPSAELVNMIHLLGNRKFEHLFDKKVFAFAGVSSGRGGRLPSMQLSSVFEKLISHLNKISVCSPAKFESHYSPSELSHSGDFELDSDYQKHFTRFISYNIDLSLKFQ